MFCQIRSKMSGQASDFVCLEVTKGYTEVSDLYAYKTDHSLTAPHRSPCSFLDKVTTTSIKCRSFRLMTLSLLFLLPTKFTLLSFI